MLNQFKLNEKKINHSLSAPNRLAQIAAVDDETINLSSNSNPLGQTTKKFMPHSELNELEALKECLSNLNGLDKDSIYIGNLYQDLVSRIINAYCYGNDEIIISQYAFMHHANVVSRSNNIRLKEIEAFKFNHDLSAMKAAISSKTKLIFIVNPNNPTGTYLDELTIYQFLNSVPSRIKVVIDESFYEYIKDDYKSAACRINEFNNLIVIRTLSKAYGLSKHHFEYLFANPTIINQLTRNNYMHEENDYKNARNALLDQAHLEQTLMLNKKAMNFLTYHLDYLNVSYIPSQTNFLMVNFGENCQRIYGELIENGIMTRSLEAYQLPHYLRISTGTLEQMEKLMTHLYALISNKEFKNESTYRKKM